MQQKKVEEKKAYMKILQDLCLVIWWGKYAFCFGDDTPGLRRFFVKVVQSLRVADRLGFVDAKLPLGVDKVRLLWLERGRL